MQIIVSPAGTELRDPENCRSFSVAIASTIPTSQLPELFAAACIGELDDGGAHVRVDVQSVRDLAAGRVSPEWDDEFGAMLAYARSRGWLSPAGDRVRAHIERPESPGAPLS